VGLVILVIILILIVIGSASLNLLRKWNSRGAQVHVREPIPSLHYCSAEQNRPCILSFTLDSHENMVVNVLIDRSTSPDFYLKIRQAEAESIYECQNVQGFSTSFACTGKQMSVGDVLQFLIISKKEDRTLAEGNFPIIGLAVATPEVYATPTFIPAFDHRPK
jgi:hypothetical protein